MDQHDWDDWPDDSPSLGDHESSSLGEHDSAPLDGHDTVDLGDPNQHAAAEYDGYGEPFSDHDGTGDTSDHSAPLPDDTFDGHPDDQRLGGHDGLGTADDGADDGSPDPATHGAPPGSTDGLGAAEPDHPNNDHPSDDRQPTDDRQPVDALVGADPDVDPSADDWHHDPFPAAVELTDPPEPIDGYPWSDAATLGGGPHEHPTADHGGYGAPPSAELLEYAGLDQPADGDAWATLLSSDDPATSSLARWWGAG
jgi:hypothetical protein